MSTEPEPLSLAEAVHRAALACDPAGRLPSATDAIARFEDRDEPIAGIAELDLHLAEEFGALDPQEEDPVIQMIRATTVYLGFRRDNATAGDEELLRLAARAEYDGDPPELIRGWLAERGVAL